MSNPTCACGRPFITRDEDGLPRWNLCRDCVHRIAAAAEERRLDEGRGGKTTNDWNEERAE